MSRVVVIGYAPDAVDFSDPALPPGMDAARVADGLRKDLQHMHDRGWVAEHLLVRSGATLDQTVRDHLRQHSYDCIVIGAGVRLTTRHVPEFEVVVNAIRQEAPQTPIAFNASPDSSADAATRWLPQAQ